MTTRLEGSVAIVTGAGYPNGIGAEVALRFAAESAHVLMTEPLSDGGRRTADQLAREACRSRSSRTM